jgi:hypothetical protein
VEANSGEQVGTAQQASAVPNPVALWNMPLFLCFTRTSGNPDEVPPDAEFATLKAEVLAALAATWDTLPGISFTVLTSCLGPPAEVLKINLLLDVGAACGLGKGAECTIGARTQKTTDANGNEIRVIPIQMPDVPGPGFTRVIMHEVGHGLGLQHEHQRPDANLGQCQYVAKLSACNACIAQATQVGMTCAGSHYNGCFNATETASQVIVDGSHYGDMVSFIQNMEPIEQTRILTRYDPLSIMNYCGMDNGREESDFAPTDLDYLGLSMLYPGSFNDRRFACDRACFLKGSNGVLVSDSGKVVTDWTARGAVIANPTWVVGGSTIVAPFLSAAQIPAGTGAATFSFPGPLGGTHTGSGALTKSNSEFAAVAMTLL